MKWMVVCGVCAVELCGMVSPVMEKERYVWSAPMGMGGMVKDVIRCVASLGVPEYSRLYSPLPLQIHVAYKSGPLRWATGPSRYK